MISTFFVAIGALFLFLLRYEPAIASSHVLSSSSWTTHADLTEWGDNQVDSKFPSWGSYRPGIYFGLKNIGGDSLSPEFPLSAVSGMLWGSSSKRSQEGLRHDTQQGQLSLFEWTQHDGSSYGSQRLKDQTLALELETSFVSFREGEERGGGEENEKESSKKQEQCVAAQGSIWAQRISTKPYHPRQPGQQQAEVPLVNGGLMSVMWYLGLELPHRDSADSTIVGTGLNMQNALTVDDMAISADGRTAVAVGRGSKVGEGTFVLYFSLATDKSECNTMPATVKEGCDLRLTYSGRALDADTAVKSLQRSYRRHTGHMGQGHYRRQRILNGLDGSVGDSDEEEIRGPRGHHRGRRTSVSVNDHSQGDMFSDDDDHSGKGGALIQGKGLYGDGGAPLDNNIQAASSFFAVQAEVSASMPFTMNVVMQKRGVECSQDSTAGERECASAEGELEEFLRAQHEARDENVKELLACHSRLWETKFDQRFGLSRMQLGQAERDRGTGAGGEKDGQEFSLLDVKAAQAALSSLLGGQGHFYGIPRVGSSSELSPAAAAAAATASSRGSPTEHAHIELLSTTPSRTAFPRGFLWDEGFHQLLVYQWEPQLCMRILSSWLQGMYVHKDDPTGQWGGWLPREMILGDTATSRVPDEFVTQRVDIANPPTLLLAIRNLVTFVKYTADNVKSKSQSSSSVEDRKLAAKVRVFLNNALPSLHRWVTWLVDSQRGETPGSFRWRGRSKSDGKLVPNTLASGLDDYPRSPVPSAEEKHIDLHCWIALSVRILDELEQILRVPTYKRGTVNFDALEKKRILYADASKYLNVRLFDLHWFNAGSGSKSGRFADVGLAGQGDTIGSHLVVQCSNAHGHTQHGYMATDVVMRLHKEAAAASPKKQPNFTDACPASHPNYMYPLGDGKGGYLLQDKYTLGGSVRQVPIAHDGYVTLFPFLLRLLSPSPSPSISENSQAASQQQLHLDAFTYALDLMEQPDQLWSPFGLRSISKQDAFYNRGNSPGDAPYWRGPIWMPINHLALGALHHYGFTAGSLSQAEEKGEKEGVEGGELSAGGLPQGELRTRVRTLYRQLRTLIIRNVLSEYHRTGEFWEQYDDATGAGIRGHPFTGWTSLLVNMMAERY